MKFNFVKETLLSSAQAIKNRTLFSLSFCLDTTASSAQVQKNEKIKSLIILQFTPLLNYTETLVHFGDFYISVSRLRSIHLKGIERSRDARFP